MSSNSIARSYSEKGKTFHRKKEYALAIQEFQRALNEFDSAGDVVSMAEMKNNIGVCMQMMGKTEEAIQEINGTADIFALEGNVEYQAMALGNEASALEDLKRLDEALSLYRQAEKLLEDLPKNETRSIILKRISSLELKAGNHIDSLASMNLALQTDPKPSQKEHSLKKVLSRFFHLIPKL